MLTRARLGLGSIVFYAQASRHPDLRPLIPQIRACAQTLPARYDALPLPDFLAELTPTQADLTHLPTDDLRKLIDSMARIDRRHPFGLCLRRSLLRYHFLRRAGLPLGIVFGVRMRPDEEGGGVAGHAWNTLDGRPYHERAEDYRGFRPIYAVEHTN